MSERQDRSAVVFHDNFLCTAAERGQMFLRRLRWEWEHRRSKDAEEIKISRRLVRGMELGDNSLSYYLLSAVDARLPRSGPGYRLDQISLRLVIEALDEAEVHTALSAIRRSLGIRLYEEFGRLRRDARSRLLESG